MGGHIDPSRMVQKTEVSPCEQMVYAQTRIYPGEWDTQTPLGFWDKNRSPNLGQTTRPCNNQQQKEKKKMNKERKKRTWRIVDFAVLADSRVKLKGSEKKDKYPDLARELKKLDHKSNGYTNCNGCSEYSH